MKPDDEMRRLLDEPPEALGELGVALRRVQSDLPSVDVVSGMAARLGVTLPEPRPPEAPVSRSALWKVAGGAGVAGAVLWAALRGTAPSDGAPPRSVEPAPPASQTAGIERSAPPGAVSSDRRVGAERPRLAGAPPPASAIGEPEPAPPIPTSAGESSASVAPEPGRASVAPEPGRARGEEPRTEHASPSRPAAAPAQRRSVKTPSDAPSAPGRAPVASGPSETELLRDARVASRSDPARALALTEQHRRDYPGGAFSQEREFIAIGALVRLGRVPEARVRAERFRSAFPTSPYGDRLDQLLPP